ncbi:MAG: hypothetical protein HY782_07440 [Chloroflexi bacterium]|nr:hypothetical protein [Chloroflexota bacterium]
MLYEIPWRGIRDRNGRIEHRPFVTVQLRTAEGLERHHFLLDSGADSAMAPRYAFPDIGIPWSRGKLQVIKGVARKRGSQVVGRVHEELAIISDTYHWLTLPKCFVNGDVPFVMGRQVFFDLFHVCFDKSRLMTILETRE